MVRKSDLKAHAAALKAELAKKNPCIDTLKGIFEKVEGDCDKRLSSEKMHETGLMEQIVALAQA